MPRKFIDKAIERFRWERTIYPPVPSASKELSTPNRIRVETAFSRFPIHCLSKRGGTTIDLHRIGEDGIADFRWEVTHNAKYGQPGPLAYKVDTGD